MIKGLFSTYFKVGNRPFMMSDSSLIYSLKNASNCLNSLVY